MSDALVRLWDEARPQVLDRITVVEDAVAELVAGALDDGSRERARGEAHKLAGLLGTFGFPAGGAHARELERALEQPPDPALGPLLARRILAIREEVDGTSAPSAAPAQHRAPRVLALGLDPARFDALRREAAARGFALAKEATGVPPSVALLDAGLPNLTGTISVLTADGGAPSVAVVVRPEATVDRVALLRAGVRAFLPADLEPAAVIDELAALEADAGGPRGSVLALDDDPTILKIIEVALGRAGHEVLPCRTADELWGALGTVTPDVVLLDVELGEVDGIEVCRALRADRRWRDVPVVFLTGATDPATVSRLFAAGADDFVAKPVTAQELTARVAARLQRRPGPRDGATVDALSGLPFRHAVRDALDFHLRTAARHHAPVSVAIVSVDNMQAINDGHGVAVGDAVLGAVGQVLRARAGPDVLAARLAGRRFLLALPGLGEHDARPAIEALLGELQAIDRAPQGMELEVSAGLAVRPVDGEDIDGLIEVAMESQLIAMAAGGGLATRGGVGVDPEAGSVDVALVEDDEALARLILHTLETAGLRARWITDGEDAARLLGGDRPVLHAAVVLLDWDLPSRDGLTVLRGLRDAGVTASSRVIMLTARSAEREVVAALELGAVDHVAKPFSVAVLSQKVRGALSR